MHVVTIALLTNVLVFVALGVPTNVLMNFLLFPCVKSCCHVYCCHACYCCYALATDDIIGARANVLMFLLLPHLLLLLLHLLLLLCLLLLLRLLMCWCACYYCHICYYC